MLSSSVGLLIAISFLLARVLPYVRNGLTSCSRTTFAKSSIFKSLRELKRRTDLRFSISIFVIMILIKNFTTWMHFMLVGVLVKVIKIIGLIHFFPDLNFTSCSYYLNFLPFTGRNI